MKDSETKSFHDPCPYGNDDCPKCHVAPPETSSMERIANEWQQQAEDLHNGRPETRCEYCHKQHPADWPCREYVNHIATPPETDASPKEIQENIKAMASKNYTIQDFTPPETSSIVEEIVKWIYAYNLNIPQKELNQFIETAERELPRWVNPIIQSEYKRGRKSIIDEMKHGQDKLLDGFSHPKDCKMCKFINSL
jgi:hypothetical protein